MYFKTFHYKLGSCILQNCGISIANALCKLWYWNFVTELNCAIQLLARMSAFCLFTILYQSSCTHFVDIHQPYTNHTPTIHMKSRVYPKKRSFNYNSKFNEKYTLLLFHFSLTYNYNFWHPPQQLDGLVQERRNSTANAMELHFSCTNPSSCAVKKLQQSLNQNLDKGKRQFPLNLNCNWNLINEMDSGTARVTLNLFFPYPKFFPIKSFSDKVIPIFVEIG